MGAGLVGDDVDRYAAPQQLWEDLGAVADDADRGSPSLGLGGQRARHGAVKIIGNSSR